MASPSTSNKKPAVHFLRTYRFGDDQKDPIIDRIHTCMQDTGYDVARAARESGVSYGTIHNWIDGPTRRPQYATICAVVRCMGYDMALVPSTHKVNGHGWAASAPSIIKRFKSND